MALLVVLKLPVEVNAPAELNVPHWAVAFSRHKSGVRVPESSRGVSWRNAKSRRRLDIFFQNRWFRMDKVCELR